MDSLLGVILMMVLVIAVVTDLRSSRIPNWLTFPAMGFALAGHAWLNGIDGILFSLAGFGMGLGLFFFIYSCRGHRGGGCQTHGVDRCIRRRVWRSVLCLARDDTWWNLRHRCDGLPVGCGSRRSAAGLCCLWRRHGRGSVWSRELALPFKLRYGLAIAAGTLLFQLGIHPFGG